MVSRGTGGGLTKGYNIFHPTLSGQYLVEYLTDYRAHTKHTLNLFHLINSVYSIPKNISSTSCSKSPFGSFHRLDKVHLNVLSFSQCPSAH